MALTIAITVFLVFIVGLVLWAFLAEERRAGGRLNLPRLSGRLRVRCHICGEVYEDVPAGGLSRCPACGSFNELEEDVVSPRVESGEDAAEEGPPRGERSVQKTT